MFTARQHFDLGVGADGPQQYWAEQALARLRQAFGPQNRTALFIGRYQPSMAAINARSKTARGGSPTRLSFTAARCLTKIADGVASKDRCCASIANQLRAGAPLNLRRQIADGVASKDRCCAFIAKAFDHGRP